MTEVVPAIIPNLDGKSEEMKVGEKVVEEESKSARNIRFMNAPILQSMRSNSSDDLKSKPLKIEIEPSTSSNDNVKLPMTPRTFKSKSHIWCASKGRHMIQSCFVCHQIFGISSAEIIKKCRLCRCRAHQQCALSADVTCKRPHEVMIYDPESPEPRTPLIVFINPKSGAQTGPKLFAKLSTLLGPGQVFDLSKGGPEPGLLKFRDVPNIKILVAGGDGTVSWVLEAVTKLNFPYNPPVAILPLGTGNDLARQFGWGGGYTGEKLLPILQQIQQANISPLDRWKVSISRPEDKEDAPPRVKIMNNYLSIGTDADIALNFHHRRQEAPHLFTSRLINKMWYAYEGTRFLTREAPKLKDLIDIEIDGERCEIGNDLGGLMVVNLRNYAAGQDLWGNVSPAEALRFKKKKLLVPRCDDGILEVVGVGGAIDVGTVVSGLNKPRKLGQAIAVQINFKKIPHFDTASIQVDGEPWREKLPFTMKVCILDQANLLLNSSVLRQTLQRSKSMESY